MYVARLDKKEELEEKEKEDEDERDAV